MDSNSSRIIRIQNLRKRHNRKHKQLNGLGKLYYSATNSHNTKHNSPINRTPIPCNKSNRTIKRNRTTNKRLCIPKRTKRIHLFIKLLTKRTPRKLHSHPNKNSNMVFISPNHRINIHPKYNLHRRILKLMGLIKRTSTGNLSSRWWLQCGSRRIP